MFQRRPRLLPLLLPKLDGTSWPSQQDVGRPSFAASALYQMGYRQAFEPEAHEIADLLVAEVLPALRTDVAPEDEPYLHRALLVAAQIGAGIGIVERQSTKTDARSMDRDIGGALRVAGEDLPSMPEHQFRIALYLLQSGHYVARTNRATVSLLLAALAKEDQGES